MNREIKFRGKHDSTGRWIYGTLIVIENISAIVEGSGMRWIDGAELQCEQWNWVLRKSIGQYTGLKDKNGVEIYEGDILYDKEGVQYGIVKWNILSFELGVRHMDCYDNIVCEVVGNIYDKPELAEKIFNPKEVGELIREEKK